MNSSASNPQNSSNPLFRLWLPALFCCGLWGMAPSLIKSGYDLMNIHQTGTILVFAGLRFFLAGILVLAFEKLIHKQSIRIQKTDILPIVVLAFFQTFGQYLFYYLGAAKASGMMVSVLSGLSALIALMISAWIFRLEKMTALKLSGCLLGLAGVVVMNLGTGGLMFKANAEGMILISQVFSAFSAVLIQIFSRKSSPVLLSGWQFALGGAVLTISGLCMQADPIAWNGMGVLVLLLLALVSAGAYTLWGVLLSKWPVSSVGVFGCSIGLFGVLFSALILHESLSWKTLLSCLLISGGILLVNLKVSSLSKPEA